MRECNSWLEELLEHFRVALIAKSSPLGMLNVRIQGYHGDEANRFSLLLQAGRKQLGDARTCAFNDQLTSTVLCRVNVKDEKAQGWTMIFFGLRRKQNI